MEDRRPARTKILLIDDRSENLIALEELLEDVGSSVEFIKATSGKEGLSIAYKEDLALILLDVQMPEMDGYEVANLLKFNKKTKHVPIIFVTAINKEENHVIEGYNKGAADYLFKPLHPHITKAKVKSFLQMHNVQKELEVNARELKQFCSDLEELGKVITHDLQAPLRTIAFSAQHLEEKFRPTMDQDSANYINHIKVGSRRIKTLIENLLVRSGRG